MPQTQLHDTHTHTHTSDVPGGQRAGIMCRRRSWARDWSKVRQRNWALVRDQAFVAQPGPLHLCFARRRRRGGMSGAVRSPALCQARWVSSAIGGQLALLGTRRRSTGVARERLEFRSEGRSECRSELGAGIPTANCGILADVRLQPTKERNALDVKIALICQNGKKFAEDV